MHDITKHKIKMRANSIKSLLAAGESPTDKEEVFVEFLLVSPSYQLAHKHRTVGLTKEEKRQAPKDFKKVLEVYDACEDLAGQGFESWWESKGRFLLRAHTPKEEIVVYPVDLSQKAETLVSEFADFVKIAKSAKMERKSPVTIVTNKIRTTALHVKAALIYEKGRAELGRKTRVENWKLAVMVRLKSKWTKGIDVSSRKTVDNMEARVFLGALVSKHFKEALYIAENAARGVFPSMEPIDTGLEFDYTESNRLLTAYLKNKNLERLASRNSGLKLRKTYYQRKVKPEIKRQKMIDALVDARIKVMKLTASRD
jgi:hypothetical protein